MKDYVKENQRILDEWREKFVEDKVNDEAYVGFNPKDYFAYDGIMNKGEFFLDEDNNCRRYASGEENRMWSNAPLRILFLSKDQNGFGGEAKDVRTETFHERYICLPLTDYQVSGSLFYQNEACLIYRLLQYGCKDDFSKICDFSWEDAVKFSDQSIFARINCKKEVGKGTCPNWLLKDSIDEYRDFLRRQVVCLDADILVCCGYSKSIERTGNIILNFLNNNGFDFKRIGDECGEDVYYDYDRKKVALNIYHLSYYKYNWISTIKAYYKFLEKHPDFVNSHRK